MKHICGAKTRSGGKCQRSPLKGATRCALHGGKTPVGADSPNLKHGRYSKYLKESLQSKLVDVQSDDPLDLLPELEVQRVLFAEYIERYKSGIQFGIGDIDYLMNWAAEIGKSVERITKLKNETALTKAEMMFLAARVAELVAKYVDPDRQQAFIAELFAGVPALSTGAARQPAASGAGAADSE